MKHISKFDGCTYDISYSVAMENGKECRDDITLIWRDVPSNWEEAHDMDIPMRELVGWHYGEYNYEDAEWFIKDWYRKKLEVKPAPKKLKTMDLPIAYVNFIGACLHMIEQYNLYALLDGEGDPEIAKDHLDEVLKAFCEPLFEYDDTVIILEEDE